MKYPQELKQKVLLRMMPPHNESVAELAKEYHLSDKTLYAWRQTALRSGAVIPGDGRNAEQWASHVKFAVVLETAALAEAELGEYCRAKGLYPEQVQAWRKVCETAFSAGIARAPSKAEKADKQRIRHLEQDLRRKERALAETAALLVLRKKAAAIWGEEEAE